jgi:hypothetical protein
MRNPSPFRLLLATALLLEFYRLQGGSIGTPAESPVPAAVQAAGQDAVCEAVFRYQMNSTFGGNFFPKSCPMVYLSVNGNDPSEDVMLHLAGAPIPLSRVSQCTTSGMRVRDKRTGAQGAILKIDGIRWIDRDEAEVEGGYYRGGLDSSGNEYHVEMTGNHWEVISDIMKSIS